MLGRQMLIVVSRSATSMRSEATATGATIDPRRRRLVHGGVPIHGWHGIRVIWGGGRRWRIRVVRRGRRRRMMIIGGPRLRMIRGVGASHFY